MLTGDGRSILIFLSTLSLRRATWGIHLSLMSAAPFLSTLSLRRATAAPPAPRGESSISIHALLAESDLFEYIQAGTGILFLSTLSLRRATERLNNRIKTYRNFYPRSPCGERLRQSRNSQNINRISIHALLAESDQKRPKHQTQTQNFYPRSPCGERLPFVMLSSGKEYFYPRSPCGERLFHKSLLTYPLYFYPRSPCGERQTYYCENSPQINFYPRSPCGERPASDSLSDTSDVISIHALLAESDGEGE